MNLISKECIKSIGKFFIGITRWKTSFGLTIEKKSSRAHKRLKEKVASREKGRLVENGL